MAATLALIAAFLFALAATLQQKGALELGGVGSASSLVKLLGRPMWLAGTLALFVGYVFQAAALDRGRLSIIQPLLVTTVVFALPLGYFLTNQIVGRREIVGAGVILAGLALFTYFADPAGGVDNAPGSEWAVVIVVLGVALRRAAPLRRRVGLVGGHAGGRLRHRGGHPLRPLRLADQAHRRVPARGGLRAPVALGGLRARGCRHARLRPPAGVARDREARAVGRDRVGREPDRRHRDRDAPARRALEQAGVAHPARDRRARPRPGRRRGDLDRVRAPEGAPAAAAAPA